MGRGGRCSLSLAARTLALSALAPSGTGTIGLWSLGRWWRENRFDQPSLRMISRKRIGKRSLARTPTRAQDFFLAPMVATAAKQVRRGASTARRKFFPADFWAPSPARLGGAPGAARCQLLGFRAATGDTTQLAPRATQRAGTSTVSEGDKLYHPQAGPPEGDSADDPASRFPHTVAADRDSTANCLRRFC